MEARLSPELHESMEDFMEKYRAAHPVTKFIPEAMQKLEKVSEIIQTYIKTHSKN